MLIGRHLPDGDCYVRGPLPADTAAPRHGSVEADRYFAVPIRKRAFSSSGDG